MKPIRLATLLVLAAAATTTARAEEVLKHEKYQLENGLTVILHENHDLPQVAVNLWYHVGTREEPRGRSGFAHLFEHLMFMGTRRVPGSQFDVIMESGGGTNNASTDFDRTNYYDHGPASLLPTLLWLEADRMEALGSAMTQAKLDLQRDVVRNERREGYDNAPYGPAELLVWERMFPADHPYHFHVIGSHEDLLAATVEDVRAFFDTYYVPNNATLVVAGDFDATHVKLLIAGLFGTLPRGKEPPRRSAPPLGLDRVERVTLADDVQLPRIDMAWHSPAFYAPGDAEMDLAAHVLAHGENGRLRRRLEREERVAVEVDAWQRSLRLGSLFRLQVVVKPGVPLERVEALIDQELAALAEEGPTERELARARASFETETISELQSLLEAADRLNQYDAYLGRPDAVSWDLDRYRKATPQSVRDQVRRALRLDRRLILRVLPRSAAAQDLPSREARPASLPVRAFTPPEPIRAKRLANGLEFWYLERPGLPLLAARLLLPGGSSACEPSQAGAASLAAQMLSEGAGDLDALAFADGLAGLGADLTFRAEREATTADLRVLTRGADEAMALLGKALREARYGEAEFARVKALHLDRLRQVVDRPAVLADRVAWQALFGSHPYAAPVAGYPHTVDKLTLEAVKRFHARHHHPRGAVLLVAGDLPAVEALALVERHLGSWEPASEPGSPRIPQAVPGPDALHVLLVDRPDAAQTAIRFAYPGTRFQGPARVALEVLNSLFGGSFTSRLNANLREEHGYTYGAGSRFRKLRQGGAFTADAEVETGVTGAALAEFLLEFRRVRAGDVSEEEVRKARATVRYETMQSFESLAGAVEAYAPYALYHYEPSALAADLESVRGQTAEKLNVLAGEHLARGSGVLVLVGDAQRIVPQLEGLGLPAPRILQAAAALEGRLAP